MNKKTIAGAIITLCLAVPFGVSAANSDSKQTNQKIVTIKFDVSKLNDRQKADLKIQMEKMIKLKKETVQKMVKNGSITKERGEHMTKNLDERLKSIREGNLDFGKHEHRKDINVPQNETDTNQTPTQDSNQ